MPRQFVTNARASAKLFVPESSAYAGIVKIESGQLLTLDGVCAKTAGIGPFKRREPIRCYGLRFVATLADGRVRSFTAAPMERWGGNDEMQPDPDAGAAAALLERLKALGGSVNGEKILGAAVSYDPRPAAAGDADESGEVYSVRAIDLTYDNGGPAASITEHAPFGKTQ